MIYCSNGEAPNDEELLAYVVEDETINEERMRHLEHCPMCQQRLKDSQHTHKRMLSLLYRTLCPEPQQLILYCEHVLPADEVHFTPFPEQLGTDPLLKIIKEGMKRLFAQPITQQETAMVLRGESSAPLWPLRYQLGEFKLSFQPSRAQNDKMKLIGFFEELSPEQLQTLEGVGADLYHAPLSNTNEGEQQQPIMSTTVDDVGNFVFTAVSPGNYIVMIHLPDTELIVEGLSIT